MELGGRNSHFYCFVKIKIRIRIKGDGDGEAIAYGTKKIASHTASTMLNKTNIIRSNT